LAAVRQRFLIGVTLTAAAFLATPAGARKFYEDDPLRRVPTPRPVREVRLRPLNEVVDALTQTLARTPDPFRRARNANTLDEVPDSEWFTNRHAARRLTAEELAAGAGIAQAPSEEGPWEVTQWKEGTTPGFRFRDAAGRSYYLKLDPTTYPELASSAEVVGSVFFHAMGYNVPQNYIVRFHPDRLRIAPGSLIPWGTGRTRPMVLVDVLTLLRNQRRDEQGRIRAAASLLLEGIPKGPFRYHGTRSDDPNDTVPHEHRRELRGLMIPSAWLNHTDVNALNTLDMLVAEGGRRFLRHFLVDFGSILGSDNVAPKTPRSGFENLVERGPLLRQMFTLGLWIPDWARAHYPGIDAVGRFEAEFFEPQRWHSDYPVPAFSAARPDDWYWGLKLVLAFTEEDIRTVLRRAEYSDPEATEWVATTLLKRREKIARYYLDKVLAVDDFSIENNELRFQDTAELHGFGLPRTFTFEWGRFNNDTERSTLVKAASPAVPAELRSLPAGAYISVRVRGAGSAHEATAYFRRTPEGWHWVGLDRL
jgi:hypothetical protein